MPKAKRPSAPRRPVKAGSTAVAADRASTPAPPVARSAAGSPARAAKAAARRDLILDAALDEFSARGFAAARLDDVAARAGVAKGTIYLHFKDKESLFQELVRAKMVPVVGSLETVFGHDAPLRAIVDIVVEFFVREVCETRRKLVVRLVMSEGPRFPTLAEFYYREVVARGLEAVRGLLRRAHERGELADDRLIRFPQLLAAPFMTAIIWSSLFDRFEPLDVRAMLRAHFERVLEGGGRS